MINVASLYPRRGPCLKNDAITPFWIREGSPPCDGKESDACEAFGELNCSFCFTLSLSHTTKDKALHEHCLALLFTSQPCIWEHCRHIMVLTLWERLQHEPVSESHVVHTKLLAKDEVWWHNVMLDCPLCLSLCVQNCLSVCLEQDLKEKKSQHSLGDVSRHAPDLFLGTIDVSFVFFVWEWSMLDQLSRELTVLTASDWQWGSSAPTSPSSMAKETLSLHPVVWWAQTFLSLSLQTQRVPFWIWRLALLFLPLRMWNLFSKLWGDRR